MAELQHLTLSKRIVGRLAVEDKDTVFWDRDLPGFGMPSMANRTVETLSRLFHMADWGLASEGGNRCRFVKKYAKRKSRAVPVGGGVPPAGQGAERGRGRGQVSGSGVAALRLLMLTGCRRKEILTLRWEDVDLEAGELRLRDAKTGARQVALSPSARKLLSELPRKEGNPWVITGQGGGKRLSNLNAPWLVVRKRAGLEDVRIHDLRHSFASRALALGESLTMIGKLLGHRQVQTTARPPHQKWDIFD